MLYTLVMDNLRKIKHFQTQEKILIKQNIDLQSKLKRGKTPLPILLFIISDTIFKISFILLVLWKK